MIITVFGATGMIGKYVVSKALAQGYAVKAFGRNVDSIIDADTRDENLVAIKGYILDEGSVYEAVKNSNAVISVLGGSFDGNDKARSLGMKNIITQMKKAGLKRIIALGGKGILQADEKDMIMDRPDYPEMYLPVGREHLQAFHYLQESNLDWTIVGAPDLVDVEGNGEYTTNINYPPQNDNGKIDAGNLASFLLHEATNNKYVRQRVGISNV